MVVRFGMLSYILAGLMYKDKMTAKRRGTAINPDGSKGSGVLNSFLENEPCIVHETSSDTPRDDSWEVVIRDVDKKEISVVVFCSATAGIAKGDFLELSITGDDGSVKKTIKGYAGEPACYQDHLEIKLVEWSVG